MSGTSWTATIVATVSGLYFAALCASAIHAIALPRHISKVYAVAFVVAAGGLALLAFRTALFGESDEGSVLSALWTGIVGAFLAVFVVIALYLMFGFGVHAFFAHSVGLHASQVTIFRLLVAFVCLGFSVGFVLRMQKARQ